MKKRKILIAPYEIAGYYANLTRGMRELGLDCDFITYESHGFKYGGESDRPFLLTVSDIFIRKNTRTSILFRFFRKVLQTIWAIFACFKYDIFIFSFGNSLIRFNIDIIFIRLLGKKVISNLAHGSEARPTFIDGSYKTFDGLPPSITFLDKINRSKKKIVTFHQKYCNIIIGAPFSTSYFLSNKFINFFSLGIPIISEDEFIIKNDSLPSSSNQRIRILHSPSHPAVKGTSIILNAINNLKLLGYNIDFITIHGRPFEEVINEIKLCDFVVDQIYSDTPMAGFATEAACFGKPAIVAGYGLESLKEYIPESMWPPSLICVPNDIQNAIEDLILNVNKRNDLGIAAQKFVCEKWNAIEVAKKYLRIINNDIPKSWWLDPFKVSYLHGVGQSEEETKKIIHNLVMKHGKKSLQVSNKPSLENLFLAFSDQNYSFNKKSNNIF